MVDEYIAVPLTGVRLSRVFCLFLCLQQRHHSRADFNHRAFVGGQARGHVGRRLWQDKV